MQPLVPTCSPAKPNKGSSWERISNSGMSICLKVFQKGCHSSSLDLQGLLDDAVSYLHAHNHWVVLHWFNCLEVLDCEGYRRHVRHLVPGDHVDKLELLKVSFLCGGSGPTPSEASNYVVYDPPRLVKGSFFFLPGATSVPLHVRPSCMFPVSSLSRLGSFSPLRPV